MKVWSCGACGGTLAVQSYKRTPRWVVIADCTKCPRSFLITKHGMRERRRDLDKIRKAR